MSTRVYVDTNVYLDYFEGRTDGIRPLGEFAYSFFRRALGCEFEIVISDLVIRELKKHEAPNKLHGLLLHDLKSAKKLIAAKSLPEERASARTDCNPGDMIHALIAKRAGCAFIVTRNIADFLNFSSIIEAKLPEEA